MPTSKIPALKLRASIATFLLLLAVIGNLAPVALAISAPPPHACCLRKNVHHCRDSAISDPGQASIYDTGCCNRNFGRATVAPHWAHSRAHCASFSLQAINARVLSSHSDSPSTTANNFPSTRAPPAC
jgi:hypothetical protein